MEDLNIYLSLPPQLQLYSEGLALFRKYCMNSHGQHYAKISAGPYPGNRDILLHALTEAPREQKKPTSPVITVTAQPVRPVAPTSSQEVELAIELKRLRQERKRTSQQFHDCDPTNAGDSERALICDRIDELGLAIKAAANKFTYLQRYGYLPKEENEADTAPLPDTLEACQEEQQKLNSHLLKIEKSLAYLLGLNRRTPGQKKQLTNKQERLQILTARRSAVRIKIQQLKQDDDASTT